MTKLAGVTISESFFVVNVGGQKIFTPLREIQDEQLTGTCQLFVGTGLVPTGLFS